MRTVKTLQRLALEGQMARCWYQHAQKAVRTLAEQTNNPVGHVADVLAITSPGITVSQNVRVAARVLHGGAVIHPYGKGIRAALAHWRETGEIRGAKTSAFAANLRGDLSRVTLDRWMARIMLADVRWPVKQQREAVRRVKRVARALGWEPAEVQAALWHAAMVAAGYTVPDEAQWLQVNQTGDSGE